MSAQPDPAHESVLAEPVRIALWRESTNGKGAGLIPIADAFLVNANRNGGTFTSKSVAQLIHALTATQGALGVLPRWVAEAFAEVLHLDPSVLRPEGAPPPLRAVPHTERKLACPTPKLSHPSGSPSSVTPAGRMTARTAMADNASASTTGSPPGRLQAVTALTHAQGTHDESPSAGVAGSMVPPAVAPPASPADWRLSARCAGMDVNLFSARGVAPPRPQRRCVLPAPWRRVPIVSGKHWEPYGIWGGTNERQRRVLKRHQDLSDAELLALADSLSPAPRTVAKPEAPKPVEAPKVPEPEEQWIPIPPGHKRCRDSRCRAIGGVLPLESFHVDNSRADGRAIYCRHCATRRKRDLEVLRAPEAQAELRERHRLSQRARYRARRTA